MLVSANTSLRDVIYSELITAKACPPPLHWSVLQEARTEVLTPRTHFLPPLQLDLDAEEDVEAPRQERRLVAGGAKPSKLTRIDGKGSKCAKWFDQAPTRCLALGLGLMLMSFAGRASPSATSQGLERNELLPGETNGMDCGGNGLVAIPTPPLPDHILQQWRHGACMADEVSSQSLDWRSHVLRLPWYYTFWGEVPLYFMPRFVGAI